MADIFLGVDVSSGSKVNILGAMANRHGLITGATGTGKTVTLQVLAEAFSRAGVAVFAADVKGDLSGIATAAVDNEKLKERVVKLKIENFTPRACPVIFWDLYGKNGHPVRTSIEEVGPLLLGHLLELNETQEGVLQIAFKLAEDEKMPLLDLKDLKAVLSWMLEGAEKVKEKYGNVSSSSVAAIQRRILVLSESGAEGFFGEPVLNIEHLMQVDFSGQGVISLLDAKQLMMNPRTYCSFLLWMLTRLFEKLPEVGDQALPKMVFFFDEAHLLFDQAPKALLNRVEQVVRLIRSKGVGIYFISQQPRDISSEVLAQLGNRIQHALRGYTPDEKEAIKIAAKSFRQNPSLDTEKLITELNVGEALVSVLDEKGTPTTVSQVWVKPPESKIGPITDAEKLERISKSPLRSTYEQSIDRESAYEMLQKRKEEEKEVKVEREKLAPRGSTRQTPMEAFVKSAVRTVGTTFGRKIAQTILNSFLGKR